MTLEEKYKIALKKDFDLLYQKEFTTDWKEQRFIRGLEIDAMSLPNLAKIAEEGREVIAEGTPFEIAEEIVKWEIQKPKYCETKYKIFIQEVQK